MTTKKLIEGLTILMPFYDKPDGYHNGAEHDMFYAYATDKPLTPEALSRVIELGWLQDVERDDDVDFTAEHYNPDEGWYAYV